MAVLLLLRRRIVVRVMRMYGRTGMSHSVVLRLVLDRLVLRSMRLIGCMLRAMRRLRESFGCWARSDEDEYRV